jgi:large subunit ribosomal protein L28
MTGNSIVRRGKAKKEGGVGKKTTGISKRRFNPNLQSRRIIINGRVRKVLICVRCIKSGNVAFACSQPKASS